LRIGAVQVQACTWGWSREGRTANDFAVAEGATLLLAGTHTHREPVNITGEGNLSAGGNQLANQETSLCRTLPETGFA